jgi:hypothetical protein
MFHPLYREVLRQAWRLTWHQRLLWVLGLFSAALVSGGAIEVVARHVSWSLRPSFSFMSWRWGGGWQLGLAESLWLVALGLLLLGLAAFFIFVMIRSFICLIIGANEYKPTQKLDLEKLWHEGRGFFWPVLSTVVLSKGLVAFLGALTVLPLVLLVGGKWTLFLAIIYPVVFLAGVLASMIVSFLMVFVTAFLVLEKYSWQRAVVAGWRLFAKHWLVSLEMAIVLFAIDLALAVVLALGAFLVAIPAIAVVIFARFIMLPGLGAVAVFVASVLAAGLVVLAAGFLGAFRVGSWILLFERMKKETAVSKLVRLVEHVKLKIKSKL